MSRHRKIHVEAPRTGSGTVFGFIAILVCSIGALAFQTTQSPSPMARTVLLERDTSAPADTRSAQAEEVGREGLASEIDEMIVSSAQADEVALCNVDTCANAYRSFRAADCTFQPFEGPRRLCTR